MLKLNTLLRAADLDPARVRLVRHRHQRSQDLVYEAALNRDERFDQYQRGQDNPSVVKAFSQADWLASFVVDPRHSATVFAGIWRVLSVRAGFLADPFRPSPAEPTPSAVTFETARSEALSQYHGRLVVAWGAGERAWVQRADLQDKEIVELRRENAERPFPGFDVFRRRLHEVRTIPQGWDSALRSTRGVYLLVHDSGQQYVGSAIGNDGFLGRWLCYVNGHGGNVGLRELAAAANEYDVAILEVAGSSTSEHEIHEMETRWKNKLGSRTIGLNRN